MPSPGPPGEPFRIVAMSPLTPSTYPVHGDASKIVDAAQRSGRIGPASRGRWLRKVRAGGRQGADTIMDLLALAPVGPRQVHASRGQDGADDDEAVWAAMYPDTPAPGPPAEPNWMGMADTRHAWLTSVQASDPPHHETMDHGAIRTPEHEHRHTDYAGETHVHPHAHANDRSHAPDGVNHVHQLAASNPVTAGIQPRAAGTAAADLSDDEVFQRLYGDG